ncbi:MAG: translation initiation factor IF-3 [Anaerolineales bacterium]|nr:translation initiation factor IF-3 [Anaerolineales bacterium]
MSTSDYRVNRAIRAKEVRLIDGDGENRGVVSIEEALRIAEAAGLDLVEVAPNSNPPVCRVVSYGKFTYERTKKEREARKAQKKIEIKEIRLRPKTTEHHRGFKTKAARGWLQDGKKVRVRIRFRGRERDYPEIALQDLKEIAAELEDVSFIEQAPAFEGRTLLMVLAPSEGAAKAPKAEAPQDGEAEAEAAPQEEKAKPAAKAKAEPTKATAAKKPAAEKKPAAAKKPAAKKEEKPAEKQAE